jgi:hypothetical protein
VGTDRCRAKRLAKPESRNGACTRAANMPARIRDSLCQSTMSLKTIEPMASRQRRGTQEPGRSSSKQIVLRTRAHPQAKTQPISTIFARAKRTEAKPQGDRKTEIRPQETGTGSQLLASVSPQ